MDATIDLSKVRARASSAANFMIYGAASWTAGSALQILTSTSKIDCTNPTKELSLSPAVLFLVGTCGAGAIIGNAAVDVAIPIVKRFAAAVDNGHKENRRALRDTPKM